MKKVLFIILLIASSIDLYAQSAAQQANKAFVAGNYSDAIQLYEFAASTSVRNETERKRLYDVANKCRKVVSLHTKAQKAYQAKDYETAMTLYDQILKYNPQDARANKCKKDYLNKTRYAKENAAWEKVGNQQFVADKVVGAKEYLKMYPLGRYKKEAENIIEDEKNWITAKATNTCEAYQQYIENSVLKMYLSDAKDAMEKIDDNLWVSAKVRGTKNAYLEYLNKQKDRNGKYVADAECLYSLAYARELFHNDNLNKAYDYFVAAKHHLNTSDKEKKEQCLEYRYYIKALENGGSIEECHNYFNKYPYYGHYFYKVRGTMRVLLCKEGKFDEAMKYASQKSEKKYVRKAKRAWKKAHK